MFVVSAKEMRDIDAYTIRDIGIPALVLMENAARAVAEQVLRLAKTGGSRWVVLVGKGNNGADGIAAARHLQDAGLKVSLLYADDPMKLTGEAATQRDIALRYPLASEVYVPGEFDWSRADGLIDALLGTGSQGAPRGNYASLIDEANASGLPIVAVDIPSGLNADTGETYTPCIQAAVTVALAFTKRGLEQHPGASVAGEVIVGPIGIPVRLADEMGVNTFTLNEEEMKQTMGLELFLHRKPDTHKGTYGHVLIAAGSRSMSGAGVLCARAALHGGSGLVTWALPERVGDALAGVVPEAMIRALPDGGTGEWSGVRAVDLTALARDKDALVLGSGMGRWEGDADWLRTVWEQTAVPLVLDADGLNMLASSADQGLWPVRTGPVILTPHPGEMSRLTGLSTAEVQRDRIELARSFAVDRGVVLVLKGSRTVIAAPDGRVYINRTGNPGMATGGAGDVLAGLIGSLLAQGFPPEQAAVLGVFLHGQAGDRAASVKREYALSASDIVQYL